MLGVSLRTVQVWVDGGLLEGWRTIGGHRRITKASVEQLMKGRNLNRPFVPDGTVENRRDMATMLVVEDEADLLELYRATIASWELPINLITASDGFEGLIGIGEHTPDLLVTDLSMPGMDGFRMLDRVHGYRVGKDMQIVVVTGLSRDEITAQGGIPKDIPVLSKPVPFARLRALAEEVLARRSARVAAGPAA